MSRLILLVEDDENIRSMVRSYLDLNGYTVTEAAGGTDFACLLSRQRFDLILLDLGLPDADGMALLSSLRRHSDAPVFVVSGRTGVDTRLQALELGADDFIAKPFSMRELELRIRNFLLRQQQRGHEEQVVETIEPDFRIGGWTLVPDQYALYDQSGASIALTRGELAILETLASARGRVVGRDRLLDALQRIGEANNPESVTVLIYRVRRKLATLSDEPLILTVAGVGYRLNRPSVRS